MGADDGVFDGLTQQLRSPRQGFGAGVLCAEKRKKERAAALATTLSFL